MCQRHAGTDTALVVPIVAQAGPPASVSTEELFTVPWGTGPGQFSRKEADEFACADDCMEDEDCASGYICSDEACTPASPIDDDFDVVSLPDAMTDLTVGQYDVESNDSQLLERLLCRPHPGTAGTLVMVVGAGPDDRSASAEEGQNLSPLTDLSRQEASAWHVWPPMVCSFVKDSAEPVPAPRQEQVGAGYE